MVPTLPSHHGWAAIHSTVSYPSRFGPQPSSWNGTKRPSEAKRPRTSWITTAYPWDAKNGGDPTWHSGELSLL